MCVTGVRAGGASQAVGELHLGSCGVGARCSQESSLAGLESRILFVDNKYASAAADDLGTWRVFQCT